MFAEIYRAWLDHSVLLFRDQQLSDTDLIAFSRRFGTLDQRRSRKTAAGSSKVIPRSTSYRT
jgi:alpha-ketoglutarate-dependent taurine dioxygenase